MTHLTVPTIFVAVLGAMGIAAFAQEVVLPKLEPPFEGLSRAINGRSQKRALQ